MFTISKENLSRILEIKEKGPESATYEDIPIVFGVTCEFLNINPEAQQIIKDLDIKIEINIKGTEPYIMTIFKDQCKFDQNPIDSPDFSFITDLKTISKLLLGELDPIIGLFSGAFKVKGNLYYMIIYLELLDLAGEKLGILSEADKKTFIKTKDLKKLFNVYMEGTETMEPSTIPLFLEVLTTYANLNPVARDFISAEKYIFIMEIRDVGSYVIHIEDGRARWYEGTSDNYSLKLNMDIQTSAYIVLSGDAVIAYMTGNVNIEGNLLHGLYFQRLIQMFLEDLNLLEK